MNKQCDRDQLIERRQDEGKNQDWWQQLTLSQKFSANSLTNYGYELAFIRQSEAGSVAVLIKQEFFTTIADDGAIDTRPNLHLRS